MTNATRAQIEEILKRLAIDAMFLESHNRIIPMRKYVDELMALLEKKCCEKCAAHPNERFPHDCYNLICPCHKEKSICSFHPNGCVDDGIHHKENPIAGWEIQCGEIADEMFRNFTDETWRQKIAPHLRRIKDLLTRVAQEERQKGKDEAVDYIEKNAYIIQDLSVRDNKMNVVIEKLPEGQSCILVSNKILERARTNSPIHE